MPEVPIYQRYVLVCLMLNRLQIAKTTSVNSGNNFEKVVRKDREKWLRSVRIKL